MDNLYTIDLATGPLISLALHDGHFIEDSVLNYVSLSEQARFREEDPYTAEIADLPISRVTVHSSRFMVDLNRPKEKAIYKKEEDAWGLKVWKSDFPEELEQGLMRYYDKFYQEMDFLIRTKVENYGYFLIFDIHSYNYRRENPFQAAPSSSNPDINLGTFYIQPKWQILIEKLKGYLSACKIKGEYPDVRENIIFKGGWFSQWVNRLYGDKGSVISIEFKKTFMDEWTGRADIQCISQLNEALKGAIPMLNYELVNLHKP